MRLSPVAKTAASVMTARRVFAGAFLCGALLAGFSTAAFAQGMGMPQQGSGFQQQPAQATPYQPMTPETLAQAMAAANGAQRPSTSPATPYPGLTAPAPKKEAPALTQSQLDAEMQDRDSPQYKAHRLADQSKKSLSLFGKPPVEEKADPLSGKPYPPQELAKLQHIHETYGTDYNVSDDLIDKEIALDMRRDAQREAALSYGARGGFASRAYEIMEHLDDYEGVLDGVIDFRQLLIKAPSGLMIEPPIVREAVDAMTITDGGNEAAVADQVLKINRQAKIVSAARNWRQYLTMTYETEIAPPPRVLWPKDKDEQAQWNAWVKQGWEAGLQQAEDTFTANLNQMVSDYNGMVRYRTLLAEGKITQPYAMHEDRGVTGGNNEMRVGDRALRITGPSQFMTGADLWKPADR
jgi:defect-in-organelle-trafficking protein DotC